MPLNPKEVISALPDALIIKAGFTPPKPHPMAEQLAELSMKDLAVYAGELTILERNYRPSNEAAVLGLGLGRSDFGIALGDSLRYFANNRYDAFADHLPLCGEVQVADFREILFPDVNVDTALEELNENSEYTAATFIEAMGTVGASLKTFGRRINISRQLFVNDDIGLISNLFASMGSGAARIENKLIFEGLDKNSNLQDGEPLFHVDLGNVEASELSATSLAAAVSKLRKMKLRRDEAANTKARFIVTAADLEMVAHRLNYEHGSPFEVITSPNIKDGRWYVFADPDVAPVIQLLKLKGSSSRPVMIEPDKSDPHFEGVKTKARSDIGVAIVGRSGVIRGGVDV